VSSRSHSLANLADAFPLQDYYRRERGAAPVPSIKVPPLRTIAMLFAFSFLRMLYPFPVLDPFLRRSSGNGSPDNAYGI